MFFSYRNQKTDLQFKSIDWFLYEENFSIIKIKTSHQIVVTKWTSHVVNKDHYNPLVNITGRQFRDKNYFYQKQKFLYPMNWNQILLFRK